MRRRQVLRVAKVVSALVLGCVALNWGMTAVFVGTPRNPTTVARVEAELGRDLPVGSSREAVTAWLKRRRLQFSVTPGADPGIVAIIRDTDRSLLIQGNVGLEFRFNAGGKLAECRAEWMGTGL